MQALTNLLLNGVNLAGQPIAGRLVDDAKNDSVQGTTGEHQLMKALAYLHYIARTYLYRHVPVAVAVILHSTLNDRSR